MLWGRIVWQENETVFNEVIPMKWVNEEDMIVYWPVKVNALRAMNEERSPEEGWKEFKMLKKKVESGQCSFIYEGFSQIT